MTTQLCEMCGNAPTAQKLDFGFGKLDKKEKDKWFYKGKILTMNVCESCHHRYHHGDHKFETVKFDYEFWGAFIVLIIGILVSKFYFNFPSWNEDELFVNTQPHRSPIVHDEFFIMLFISVYKLFIESFIFICFGAAIGDLIVVIKYNKVLKFCRKRNYIKALNHAQQLKKLGYKKVFWPDSKGNLIIFKDEVFSGD